MSKHNNSTSSSSAGRCYCGRKITIGEEKGGVDPHGYECPTCFNARYRTPLTRYEYYSQFGIKPSNGGTQ